MIPEGTKIWLGGRLVDAPAMNDGDELIPVGATGDLLVVTAADRAAASDAVAAAESALQDLGECDDDQVTAFFNDFAAALADDEVWELILDANAADVEDALMRGRSTTRLEVSPKMREAMISGLVGWAEAKSSTGEVIESRTAHTWKVERVRAPLGVVAFVFEGRPNVFADGCGVIRNRNAAVMRIGSDALGTANAVMKHAIVPALRNAGLPEGSVALVDSRTHGAAWALFSDRRVRLAIARGSGRAVSVLGAIAESHGIPASLHGTGGAWVIADPTADPQKLRNAVENSLDRKVCNTCNTIVLCRESAVAQAESLKNLFQDIRVRVHVTPDAEEFFPAGGTLAVERPEGISNEPQYTEIGVEDLGREWEWERTPEVTVHVVSDLDGATETFNRYSPCFVVSLIGGSEASFQRFSARVNAPYVGNGFTRWVDGQWAWDRPELGLTNWERGRLMGRSGILSGDDVFTVKDIFTDTTGEASQRR